MRILISILLLLISSEAFALSDIDITQDKAVQSEVRALDADGRAAVKTVSDTSLKRYLLFILDKEKREIERLFQFDMPYRDRYFSSTQDTRLSYYTEYLKPAYIALTDSILNNKVSLSIDDATRKDIEDTTVGYQQEFVSEAREMLQKYVASDIFQKWDMKFSYEGSGGYIRARIDRYDLTRSAMRDEESMNFTLSLDMDMTMPGEKSCDYTDDWEYVCTTSSGTHIAGDATIQMSTWRTRDTQYIQIHSFTVNPKIAGIDAEKFQEALAEIQKYTTGKVYAYDIPTYGVSQSDILIKSLNILNLLNSTSIFTPYAKVGEDYIMIMNPVFLTKLENITGESYTKKNRVDYLFPELKYHAWTYSVHAPTHSQDIYDFQLGKNPKNITTFGFHIATYGEPAYFSGMIQKEAWDIDLDIPDTLKMKSTWDGITTDTIITGSWIGGLYEAFLMGYRGVDTSTDTASYPKKIELSGTLTKTKTALSLFLDNITIGSLQSVEFPSFATYESWIRFGMNKFSLSGNIEKAFGTFNITPSSDAIHLDTRNSANLSDAFDVTSSALQP